MPSFFDRLKFNRKPFRDRKTADGVPKDKEAKQPEPREAKAKRGPAETGGAHRVLIRPIVSEKATRLAQEHTYVFEVGRSATKDQVARAVAAVYGVVPRRVNMAVVAGHRVRFGKVTGKMRDWKKAIVTLPTGAKIDLFSEG
ncbi:MAG: 50S ribosomal protein L23 [Patescibacteria group bacterium]